MVLAVVGLGYWAYVFNQDHAAGYHAYLVGYMTVLALIMGSMIFTIIQHVVRAGWSTVVRRISETAILRQHH